MASTIENKKDRGEQLREAWCEAMSVRRSTQQFRARLARTLPVIENECGSDAQLGDVAAVVTVVARILDWAMLDLDHVRLPDELLEVVPLAGRADTRTRG
jgi:hypothetical protein